MGELLITSFQNPRVKYLRSLRHKKYRRRQGRFLVEGIRLVGEALACGAAIETLVYAPDLLVSERAKALLAQVEPERRLVLAGDVFASLSDRESPQGLLAVVRIEDRPLTAIPLSDDLLVVVAYQLRDPGNLGTIIRTADAAGASAVIVVEPSADLYDPQAVRATMGSLFSLPVVRLSDEAALSAWYTDIRAAGWPLLVVASSAHGQRVHFDVAYDRPVVLLIGSERYGLPAAVREQADVCVRLPMAGRATSLNAAAAASALIYEIVRQRSASFLSRDAPETGAGSQGAA